MCAGRRRSSKGTERHHLRQRGFAITVACTLALSLGATTAISLRQQFPVDYARKESIRVAPVQDVLVADFRQSIGPTPGCEARAVERSAAGGINGSETVVGLIVSVIATRLMSNLLFGVSAHDPLTFTIVPLILGAVALGASLVPARRASRVAPSVALRLE